MPTAFVVWLELRQVRATKQPSSTTEFDNTIRLLAGLVKTAPFAVVPLVVKVKVPRAPVAVAIYAEARSTDASALFGKFKASEPLRARSPLKNL